MADINVTVASPGAGKASGEVKQLRQETAAAGTATVKLASDVKALTTSLNQEGTALKSATKAAKDYGQAVKAIGTDALTGAPAVNGRVRALQQEAGALVKRRQLLEDIARRGLADQVSANKASAPAAPHSTFLRSIGRGIAAGGAAVGMGGPVGTLLGAAELGGAAVVAAGGLIALGSAVHILDTALQRSKETIKAETEGRINRGRMEAAANEAISRSGVAALDSQGGNLLKLLSNGGQRSVNQANSIAVGSGLQLGDVQQGLGMLGGSGARNQDAIIKAATMVAQTGNGSFAETIKTALDEGLKGTSQQIANAVISIQQNRVLPGNFIQGAQSRISSSGLASDILSARTDQARGAVIGQNQIEFAGSSIKAQNAELANPLARMQLDAWRNERDQLDVLKAISDKQGFLEKMYDVLRHPLDNARRTSVVAERNSAAYNGVPSD